MSGNRVFDVVVWGCTGFTGRLACQYLHNTYPNLNWAIAGRSRQKVEELKLSLKLKESVEVLTADISDQNSLLAITQRTKVLLTTAGPYARLGEPVVRACVAGGAHYCDLTGEAPFIRRIADSYALAAESKKLKIVTCCGYDCIPCDLGTQLLAEEMLRQKLQPREVRFLADDSSGGVSGGTIASIFNMIESMPLRELMKLANPFYLNPKQPESAKDTSATAADDDYLVPHEDKKLYAASCDNMVPGYDSVERCWTMPYIMQGIDLRLVNRSNALMGFKYGRKFVFSERMKVPNLLFAVLGSMFLAGFQLLMLTPLTRWLLKLVLPAPGQGPSQQLLDHGYFTAKLWGSAMDPQTGAEVLLKAAVEGRNGDPGYRLTAKMISEAAVCLAFDGDKLPATYGVLTPSTAMGSVLTQRLNNSGITFQLL